MAKLKALRPPFAYYGGKTRMAKDIVSFIPADAETYVEPFAGSLAVLLRKEPHGYELVNDLDDRLIAFWRVLRDKPEELQEVLAATPYARAEFEHALAAIDEPCSDVELARLVFIILRQSRRRSTSAVAGNFRSSGGLPSGPGGAFSRSVDSLLAVSERLRHVVIEKTDALDLVDHWDRPRTVMYLDPPYVGETRTARDYTIENAEVKFHEQLMDKITDAKARIILSGYDHPVYARLGDWNRVDMQQQTGSTSASTRYATETLWMNF